MLQTLLWALPIETIHEKTVVIQKDLGHINFSKLYVVVKILNSDLWILKDLSTFN